MPLVRKRRLSLESDNSSDNSHRPRQSHQNTKGPQTRVYDSDASENTQNVDENHNDSEIQTQGDGNNLTKEQLVKKLVRLALSSEYARQPIKRNDISSRGAQRRQFKVVFEAAQDHLRQQFGVELTELPLRDKVTISQRRAAQKLDKVASTSKSYVLRSTLPIKYRKFPAILSASRAPTSKIDSSYVGLYTFIISLIGISGGTIAEAKLERHLKRVNADQFASLSSTDKLLHRLCKESYIVKIKDGSSGDEHVHYMVGPRGKVEVGVEGISGIVKAVYKNQDTDDLTARLSKGIQLDDREMVRTEDPGDLAN
ncbi:MAG: hypothetical protein M1829_001847 [Trizodia sp. TS-e1964]|nr:MAG: hypothetical protein M1829_001847 [Trizodia sp. TS-e1964]